MSKTPIGSVRSINIYPQRKREFTLQTVGAVCLYGEQERMAALSKDNLLPILLKHWWTVVLYKYWLNESSLEHSGNYSYTYETSIHTIKWEKCVTIISSHFSILPHFGTDPFLFYNRTTQTLVLVIREKEKKSDLFPLMLNSKE